MKELIEYILQFGSLNNQQTEFSLVNSYLPGIFDSMNIIRSQDASANVRARNTDHDKAG